MPYNEKLHIKKIHRVVEVNIFSPFSSYLFNIVIFRLQILIERIFLRIGNLEIMFKGN